MFMLYSLAKYLILRNGDSELQMFYLEVLLFEYCESVLLYYFILMLL